jgi:ketosteroid isomerase-like protein
MSAANVEVVRRLYEIWNEHGFGVVEELMDPAIEFVNPPDAVEPGTRRGYEGFAVAAEAVSSIYGAYEVELIAVHDLGDRIVAHAHVATRSTGMSIPIEADRGYSFDVRDGRVTRFAWFNDPAEALASAQALDRAT